MASVVNKRSRRCEGDVLKATRPSAEADRLYETGRAVSCGESLLGVPLHRQADIVFRQGLRGGARAGDVVEFGKLPAMIEGIVAGETMQHGGHPPGEALNFPDSAQTDFGVGVEKLRIAGLVETIEG